MRPRSTARPRHARVRLGAPLGAAVAALLLLAALAGPAQAAPASWDGISATIADPWPGLQGSNGHFRDYVVRRAPSPERDDYGDAVLGYGLLQRAARTGDTALRDAGFKSIAYTLGRSGKKAVSAFRYWALAAAYNLARRKFAAVPAFKSSRGRWERVLKGVKRLRIGRTAVTNKSLVEAVEILELVKTGLHSSRRRTILSEPGRNVRLVKRLVGTELPRAAHPFERKSGSAGRTVLIGDFTSLPLPYHALANGFLARAVALLGKSAPTAARRIVRESADASWALAAPDGDVGYIGRSQEQSWTLPLTAYAAETAATQPGGSKHSARYRALSARALDHLGAAYGAGPEGFFITPAIKTSLRAGIKGLDPYVAAVSYNGLSLVATEWAIGAAHGSGTGSGIGADRDGSFKLGTGTRTFATVRAGNVWFAVKQAHSDDDLRYDFGLVALQVRGDDGTWRNAMPLRPRVESAADTAGPVLSKGGAAEGTGITVAGDGKVTVSGGFRRASGSWLRRGVRFQFTPTSCGVRLDVPARKGDAFEYSAFFRSNPTATDGKLAAGGSELSYSPAASVTRKSGYASDLDPRLVRAKLRFASATGAGLSLTTCAG
jgi:hypothetical protein